MRVILSSLAVGLLLAGGASAQAEDIGANSCCVTDICDGDSTAAACCDDNVCCGSRAGIVGGVDFTLFKFFAKQGAGGNSTPGNSDDYFSDYGFMGQGRYWIGYELSNGLGVRGRLFRWQGSQEYLGIEREQEFEIYDVEATADMSCMGFNLTGFGGVRWGSIDLFGSDFGEPNPMQFEGMGMTLGMDLRRNIWGDLAVVGGVRYSVLYGDTAFQPQSGNELDNTFVDITEARLGLEWSRTTRFGGRVFASAAWEHQVYGTDSYFPFAIDPETLGDVSLGGPVFSIGFDR